MADNNVPYIGSRPHVARVYAEMIEEKFAGLGTFQKMEAIDTLNKGMSAALNLDTEAASSRRMPTVDAIAGTMVANAVSPRNASSLAEQARAVVEHRAGGSQGHINQQVRDQAREKATTIRTQPENRIGNIRDIAVSRQQQR